MNNKSLTKVSEINGHTVKTTIRKDDCGDYVVRIHVDGKFLGEPTNYYTDDKDDAITTADDLRQREVTRLCPINTDVQGKREY